MKSLFATLAALALIATVSVPARAQHARANADSASQSQAGALSLSGSGASSGASINQTFSSPGRVDYGGGYTVHNTPDVQAPVFTGGTNACTVSAGLGGAVAGFGIAGGAAWSDSKCERRALSAMLYLEGQHRAAIALLCQADDVAKAMAEAGTPCPQSLPVTAGPVAPAPLPTPPAVPTSFDGGVGAPRPLGTTTVSTGEPRCHFVIVPPRNPNGAADYRRVCE